MDRCDATFQRKVSEYVSTHVHWCLSELVSKVAPKVFEGVFEHYNEEDVLDLFRTVPDQDDCENAGYQFFQQGEYWYFESDEHNVEPEDLGEYSKEELIEFACDETIACEENTLEETIEALEDENFKIDRNHYGGDEPKTYTLWKLFDVSCHDEYDSEDEAVEACIQENDIQGVEVYEHWLVSSHLAYKLREHGQTVVDDFFGLQVWCRTCTGQSISMDYVICKIYDEVHSHEE